MRTLCLLALLLVGCQALGENVPDAITALDGGAPGAVNCTPGGFGEQWLEITSKS